MPRPKTYKQTISGIIASCVVLFVLMCSTGGLVVWNVARKVSYEYVRCHRNELKCRDTIVVSADLLKGNEELAWIKYDEIRYHGEMYDIKKQIPLADGRVMLIGHYDDWDNELFKSLERMLEPSPGRSSPKEGKTFYWLADAIISVQQQKHYNSFCLARPLSHFPKDDQAFCSRFQPDVPVPPPNRRVV